MEEILRLIATREADFPKHLLEAQKRLLERLAGDEIDSQVLTLLAEVLYWLGTRLDDAGEKEACLSRGAAYGERAAALAPDSVAAHFWYASCLAAYAMARGKLNDRSCLEPIEKHGNRALELDEAYFNAAPLRLMGWFYSKVPTRPVGPGDRKKGLELAKRAVDQAPDHLSNRVVLADAYLAARYFDQARVLLKEALAAPEPVAFRMSHARYQAMAREILERLDRME